MGYSKYFKYNPGNEKLLKNITNQYKKDYQEGKFEKKDRKQYGEDLIYDMTDIKNKWLDDNAINDILSYIVYELEYEDKKENNNQKENNTINNNLGNLAGI